MGDALETKSYADIKEMLLTPADKIYSGLIAAHNNRIAKFVWKTNPYSKGSYTCYKPGQWSAFAGIEAEPHHNIFFAGEHCSVQSQGFMNGAVETGRHAAMMIGDKMIWIFIIRDCMIWKWHR